MHKIKDVYTFCKRGVKSTWILLGKFFFIFFSLFIIYHFTIDILVYLEERECVGTRRIVAAITTILIV